MSNYNSLKTTIDANIKQNGNQEITGQILNSVLNQMVTTLGAEYQFAGVATLDPATDPGTPDAKVFYIANGKGTYEKFGGINVTEDDVVVLYWDSSWHKVATGIASQAKLSELESKVRNKSNVAFIASDNDACIVISGRSITFNPNLDIYGEGFFFRLNETQTIEEVYSGSGYIGFNIETQKFFASGSVSALNDKTLLVGINLGVDITIFATRYSYNGVQKGLFYAKEVVFSEFDKNNSNSAISQKNLYDLFYKEAIAIPRGGVSVNDNTVTLGIGDYYFYNPIDGKILTKILSENLTFTLSAANPNLVYNLNSREFSIKADGKVEFDDIICTFYDGVLGFCGGVWDAYLRSKIEAAKIEADVSKRTTGFLVGDLINVSIPDGVVTAKSFIDVYYGVGGKFKRIPAETELFTITGVGTNVVCFNPKDYTLTYGQVTNGVIVGLCIGKKFYPIGNVVKVKYSDGTSCYDNYTLSQKIDNIGDIEVSDIPEFVTTESLATYKRVVNYLGSEPAFLLAQITDVHSGGSEKYKHVGYLNSINKSWQFNVLCNSGDIGLDVGETDSAAIELMYNTKSQMNSTSPWIYCKGNHERLRTMTELGNVFMKPAKRQFPSINFGDTNGLYGYIDNEDSKVRTIYLNTSDTDSQAHYAISDEQIVWLGNTLFETKDDYKIVILTHLCPKQIGEWTDYPGDWRTASNLIKVIEGFAQRQSVYHAETSWDYSSKLAKIVCVLSGDSHFNNSIKENGVNYIVRQGYGGVSESSKPEGATSDSFSYTSQCLFDVLVIKDDSNAKIFRIGAGGETRDLEITF